MTPAAPNASPPPPGAAAPAPVVESGALPKGTQIHCFDVAAGNAVHILTTVNASAENELTFRQSFKVLVDR